MNGEEYRRAIESLGLSQVGAARFLGVNETTSRRWGADRRPIPTAVAMLLGTMVRKGIEPQEIESLAKR
jgi:DNA-binding transcriptional regulator YiaG